MHALARTLGFIKTHPLTRHNYWPALYRFSKWQLASRLRDEIEFDWVGDTKLLVRRGMTGATGNIYCGLHEFQDMGFLLHFLRTDNLFVDVGANIGSFTVLASGVCRARTIAFEPDHKTADALRANIHLNGLEEKVNLIEAAVGAHGGRVTFTMGQDTKNRVVTEGTINDIETQTVSQTTLDHVLADEAPTFIKVDVEGHESSVIEGASLTLEKPSLEAVILETVGPPEAARLQGAGFVQAVYDPFSRALTHGTDSESANSLFVRNVDRCQKIVIDAPIRTIVGRRV